MSFNLHTKNTFFLPSLFQKCLRFYFQKIPCLLKKIYSFLPFKNLLFYFFKKCLTPSLKNIPSFFSKSIHELIPKIHCFLPSENVFQPTFQKISSFLPKIPPFFISNMSSFLFSKTTLCP